MGISRLFVYGTLKQGMSNHDRFCGDALTIEPAATTGRLYHLPYGFPAMFDAPDGQVFGEVMTFPDIEKTIEAMDYLEGYHPTGRCHYLRIAKQVTIRSKNKTVLAWVYVYPQDRLEEIMRIGEVVSGGCWRKHISTRNHVTV